VAVIELFQLCLKGPASLQTFAMEVVRKFALKAQHPQIISDMVPESRIEELATYMGLSEDVHHDVTTRPPTLPVRNCSCVLTLEIYA
jgi:hypothetical protein